MPDGNVQLHAFAAMHARLLDYGLCYIRGGKGRTAQIIEWDSDVRLERREWSQPEIDAAGRLHSRIIRMPLQHSIVTQVFYGETVAHYWDEIAPDAKAKILQDLVRWPKSPKGVNARITDANRGWNTNVSGIRPDQFMDIRNRAIAMLVNGERMLP